MARTDTVALTYTADITALRKALTEIPGMTAAEARKAVRELDKNFKGMRRAQEKANKAARSTASAMDGVASSSRGAARAAQSVAQQLPDVASQLAAGTPPAQVFAQQGLQVVQSNMQAVTAAAGQTVTALAGPLGVALAAGAAAAITFANAYDEAQSELVATRAAIEDTYQAMRPDVIKQAATARRRLNDLMVDTRELLLLESGELTALDIQQMRAVETARESTQAILLETSTRWARLEVQRQELEAAVASGDLSTEETLAARLRLDTLRKELPAAKARLDALKAETQAKVESVNETYNQVQAARDKAAADAALAQSKREQAEALAVLAEAQAADRAGRSELITGLAAEREAREQLAGLQSDLEGETSFTDQARKANELLAQRAALLDQIAERIGYTAEVDAAYQDAQLENEARLSQIRAENIDFVERKRAQAAQARADAEAAELMRMQQGYSALAGGIADAAGAASQIIADQNADAAAALFAIEKAAGISQALINGAIAKTRALAMLGPIAGPIAAAGITASVGAQVALIAAQKPTFNDTPGVIQMPSGGPIGVAPGDMVVAGKDLDDMAAQVDRARGSDRRPVVEVVAIPSYQGRTYYRARRDAYRRPGPDRDAVNRDRAIGPGGW